MFLQWWFKKINLKQKCLYLLLSLCICASSFLLICTMALALTQFCSLPLLEFDSEPLPTQILSWKRVGMHRYYHESSCSVLWKLRCKLVCGALHNLLDDLQFACSGLFSTEWKLDGIFLHQVSCLTTDSLNILKNGETLIMAVAGPILIFVFWHWIQKAFVSLSPVQSLFFLAFLKMLVRSEEGQGDRN